MESRGECSILSYPEVYGFSSLDISYPARSSIVSQRRSCKLNKIRLTLLAEAMDRIHRLGQRRPVQAIKLVVEDSIESRIVQVIVPRFTATVPLICAKLQEKKSAMVDATLSTDESVGLRFISY